MTPKHALETIIVPTLAPLGAPFDTRDARLMLVAAGMQESRFEARDQGDPDVPGPARGLWQFEKIACRDFVERGHRRLQHAVRCRRAIGVLEPMRLWWLIGEPRFDPVACLLARDALFRHVAEPLPQPGDVDEAWRQYVAAWKPGQRDRERWTRSYAASLEALR